MECLVKTLTEYWQQKQKQGSLGGQVEARRVGSEHLLPSSTLAQEHRGGGLGSWSWRSLSLDCCGLPGSRLCCPLPLSLPPPHSFSLPYLAA